jgi:hypothetical protein
MPNIIMAGSTGRAPEECTECPKKYSATGTAIRVRRKKMRRIVGSSRALRMQSEVMDIGAARVGAHSFSIHSGGVGALKL